MTGLCRVEGKNIIQLAQPGVGMTFENRLGLTALTLAVADQHGS